MATVKREFALKKIEDEKLPYYEITDGRTLIAENQESGDYVKSLQDINETLDAIEDAFVIVKVSDKSKKQRGKGGRDYAYYEFKINLRPTSSQGVGSVAGLATSQVEGYLRTIDDLKRQLLQKDFEQKLAAQDRKIEELKDNSPLNNPMVINGLMSLLGGGKQSVGIAGINDAPAQSVESKEDQQKKLKSVLSRLAKVDTSILDTLSRLAEFAETNPEQYNQVKSMLPPCTR